MKRFILTLSFALAGALTGALADEVAEAGEQKFFGYSGSLGTFTKAGFNNAKLDEASGIVPTEGLTSLFGKVDTIYDFKAFITSDAIKVFKIGLGIGGNGLVWDTTKNDGKLGVYAKGSGTNRLYIGAWNGNGKVGGKEGGERHYMLHNAFIDFQSEYFNFQGGRYESGMDYHSGYTQGFNADLHFKTAPNDELKIWWFSSWGRALAESRWFLDFYAPKTKDDKNTGIHAGGIDYTHNSLAIDDGMKRGASVVLRPWAQFYVGVFSAYGGKLNYEQHFGNGYGVSATLQGYALLVSNTAHPTATQEKADKRSGNINAILKAYMYDYNLRLGVYKNFGSAGAHIGTYGNPLGIDQWTGSVYDNGALNDITSKDALTVYLSGGGAHAFEAGTFGWEILGRYTKSPRSDEASVALLLSQSFKNGFVLGLKLEWLNDTTKAGYISASAKKRTDDRSHAFVTLDYNF